MEQAYKSFFEEVSEKINDKNIRAAEEVVTEIRTLVSYLNRLAANHADA